MPPDTHSTQQVIHRLCEHFAAAAFSIQQTRSFDAVCVVVPGCICALSDAVLRRRATNHPSEVCTHLMGQTRDGKQLGNPGYGLSVSSFATQTETIEVGESSVCLPVCLSRHPI